MRAEQRDHAGRQASEGLRLTEEKPPQISVAEPTNISQSRSPITSAGLAELAADAPTTNGMVTAMFASRTMGVNLGLQDMVTELNRQVMEVQRGDRNQAEALLQCQAMTLNAIFAEMARRAALNMNSNISATEAYMRMALKAQNQARATLETLSAIRHPSVVIAKQANITSGPQQINNVHSTQGSPRTVS